MREQPIGVGILGAALEAGQRELGGVLNIVATLALQSDMSSHLGMQKLPYSSPPNWYCSHTENVRAAQVGSRMKDV
jgi:hypothetical protein